MNKAHIELKAASLRSELGGTIFAFPINESDPFSKYAVAIFTGLGFEIFPDPLSIEEAAAGVWATLEGFESEGWDSDYENNVRFVSYEAQLNAPSITMRKIRDTPGTMKSRTPVFEQGADVVPKEDDDYYVSARGLLKFSYLEMLNKNPKGIQFMNEYYKLLSTKRYGKTAASIKQEVRRMNKDQAIQWIERTYKNYITNSMEVMDIMQRLGVKS